MKPGDLVRIRFPESWPGSDPLDGQVGLIVRKSKTVRTSVWWVLVGGTATEVNVRYLRRLNEAR